MRLIQLDNFSTANFGEINSVRLLQRYSPRWEWFGSKTSTPHTLERLNRLDYFSTADLGKINSVRLLTLVQSLVKSIRSDYLNTTDVGEWFGSKNSTPHTLERLIWLDYFNVTDLGETDSIRLLQNCRPSWDWSVGLLLIRLIRLNYFNTADLDEVDSVRFLQHCWPPCG